MAHPQARSGSGRPIRSRGGLEPVAIAGLAAVAVGLALVLLHAFGTGPIDEPLEVRIKALLCALVACVLGIEAFPSVRRRAWLSRSLLAAAGVAGVLAWFNFGAFHGGGGYVHDWEQFHHRLGARYFAELGYDGLYAASIAAQIEGAPRLAVQRSYRDLRTNQVRDTQAQLDHVRAVRKRFDAQRWVEFVADHDYFVRRHGGAQLDDMRRDHGFNASPAWAAMARLVGAPLPTTTRGLLALGLLDPLLLAAAFWMVFRAFGARVGCAALAVLGLGYASRFYWVGGAFLRQDWLAAVLASLAWAERGRFRAAGAALGVAAGLRLFPVLLLFGPAVLAARAIARRERAPWIVSLGLGFGLAIAGMLAVGSLAGRGPSAWPAFANEIARHTDGWLTNDVGLENLVLYDHAITSGALIDPEAHDVWTPVKAEIVNRRAERLPARVALQALFLVLLAAAVWRSTPSASMALSVVAVFSLTAPTCYYWSLLALVPLAQRGVGVPIALLALNAAAFGLHLQTERFELRYGALSWGLAVFFAGLLVPAAGAFAWFSRSGWPRGSARPHSRAGPDVSAG